MAISSRAKLVLTCMTAAAVLLGVTQNATASRDEGFQSSVSKLDTTMKVAERKMEYSAKKVGGGGGKKKKSKQPN